MKTKKITLYLAGLFLVLFMVACDLLNTGGGALKTLTTDEAKVEIRAANQEIIDTKEVMLSSKGLNSLNYLMQLQTGDELKSAFRSGPKYAQHYSLTKILNVFRENKSLKSVKLGADEYYGILEYNFENNQFEQVGESTTMLKLSYPADETAFNKQELNADLIITDLKFTQIASTEEVWNDVTYTYETKPTTEDFPTGAKINLEIDSKNELTGSYSGAITDDGMPTSINMSMESGGYTMDMSLSGSGVNYKTSLEYKLNKDLITGYDFDIKYTADMSTVETLTGNYTVSPLKLDGTVNVNAIETAIADAADNGKAVDIDYLNTQITVDVIQVDKNAKIGVLQYKMFTDPEYMDKYPELVILYEDGTYEWLSDVMTVMDSGL